MGEPTGSRRLTDEQHTADEPGQTVPPPRVRRRQPTAPRAAAEGGDDAAADERTSPFPYSESFNEWVADETATRGYGTKADPSIEERDPYGNDPRHRPG